MTESEETVARVVAVLAEWGAVASDGDFVDDEDFAEAIRDSGAWRLARDLRAALSPPMTRVHNHPPYRPVCNERRLPDGQLRGACLDDDGGDR